MGIMLQPTCSWRPILAPKILMPMPYSPQSGPSHPIWGAGSAPGWTLVGGANSTPVPTMSKTALACTEGWKAGTLAWEKTFLRRIHSIWDVHEHRSLNELAWVSVQALRGSSPPRRQG